ncbi:tetratricopeptide repeat protein [Actinoplanes siamensis]|uniref:Tetratricopeptide repeat protein n=1 Tax=Actinoplanes siamensis TaxID=1223317 RepID=A0A919N3P1_9ACTN|nr:tetratricopeptide repeat protein [Actinoplanes siamensis]GIF03764.1 hypothetical protein Asi03nite_13020 [Actinoplanes siamensis]
MAEIYRSANAAGTIAAAENERGEMLRRAGRPGEAAAHFERALETLAGVKEPDPGTHSAILNNLALTAYAQGDFARARRCLVRSLAVGPLVGDPVGRAITYDNLGVVEVELSRRAAPGGGDKGTPPGDAPAGHAQAGPDGGGGGNGHLGEDGRGVRRRPSEADTHLREAERYFAAAERLFRSVLPEAVDDYLRSVLNRADAAEMRSDAERMDRLTRHAAEVAAHHAIAPENALEAVTMRGDFLYRRGGHPRAAVELMTARLPALLPECPLDRHTAALHTLLAAATATGDPALIEDVAARIAEIGGTAAGTEATTVRTKATNAGPAHRDITERGHPTNETSHGRHARAERGRGTNETAGPKPEGTPAGPKNPAKITARR